MDFVIIANAWTAAVHNPTSKHQIALELARQGHRVLWVESAGMRVPKIGSSQDRSRIWGKIVAACRGAVRSEVSGLRFQVSGLDSGAIWVLSPLTVPLPASAAVRALNAGIYLHAIRKNAKKLGFGNAVLVNFMPTVPRVLKSWRGRKVYYCVDRWDQFDMYSSTPMAKLDGACCRNADVVIASSNELYDRCSKLNLHTHLIPHGVNHAHFSQALSGQLHRPADLPEGKVVGFVGLLSEWIDQDLLVRLARELGGRKSEVGSRKAEGGDQRGRTNNQEPFDFAQGRLITNNSSTSLVLIGRADVPIDKLERESNIRILGPKPFAELPAYMAHFDVGIIPFAVNELTAAVNPIKFREMLAAGCPVVSTSLPEVARYSSETAEYRDRILKPQMDADGRRYAAVRVAKDSTEFVEMVKNVIENPPTMEQRRTMSNSMQAETWESKVKEILRIVA